ncbi:meiosis-specific with OB domain-containing protein-like [Haliotis cracherodii]|uniref:meiosis-specific with OB domain-containing protein-like n=1 Tax=Haliotis cracherodii TaxID=6455 RepID=UPI0039E9C1EE
MAWSGRFDDFSNYSTTDDNRRQRNRSSGGSSSFGTTASGVPVKINEITPDIPYVNLIGSILTKDGPKSIISKKGSGSERFLVSFALRDSPDALINCTCWGNEGFITNLAQSFTIGDIVEVRNAQVQSKSVNPSDDRYKPWTPSGFQLNLSENHSSVELYSGWDLSTYNRLKHVPTRPNNDYYTLEDVSVNGTALQGEHVNLLVAVKQVWPARDITTKTGKQTRKCDVVLCDETCSNFILTLWDNYVEFALNWVPRQTIIFAADVKILHNSYKDCMSATADSKTVFTVDPDTPEGHILYQFVKSQADMGSSFLADTDRSEQDPELSSIRDVYSVEKVKQWKAAVSDQEQSVHYCVMYVYVTTFNIDADSNTVFKNVCSNCKRELKADTGFICTNDQCPGSDPMATDLSGPTVEFNIWLSVSDHTGTLDYCNLQGAPAEEVLGCKATEFQSFDIPRKTSSKWSYLLERCKVVLKMKKISTDFSTKTSFRILSLSKPHATEIMNTTNFKY